MDEKELIRTIVDEPQTMFICDDESLDRADIIHDRMIEENNKSRIPIKILNTHDQMKYLNQIGDATEEQGVEYRKRKAKFLKGMFSGNPNDNSNPFHAKFNAFDGQSPINPGIIDFDFSSLYPNLMICSHRPNTNKYLRRMKWDNTMKKRKK